MLQGNYCIKLGSHKLDKKDGLMGSGHFVKGSKLNGASRLKTIGGKSTDKRKGRGGIVRKNQQNGNTVNV